MILGLALVVPGSVRAQEGRGNVGLGVGISTSFFSEIGNLLTPTGYVPIVSGEQL